jgi:hypothetical protein
MVERIEKITVSSIIMAIWPALFVMLLTLVISVFFTEFTFVSGITAIWLVFLRFFRLLLVLILPLLCLSQVYSITERFLHVSKWELVQIKEERSQIINPMQNWLLRPLQGIGLSMLIATKLILLLGIYTGSGINTSAILHPATFNPWRFLTITVMAITISLLLSYLWGLDDLGVRLYNRKTKEIRMIGKYIGVILPIFFGFYGMINIFQNHAWVRAIQYVTQMAFILYPPFLIFSVFHAFYLQRKQNVLLEKLKVTSHVNLSDISESASYRT